MTGSIPPTVPDEMNSYRIPDGAKWVGVTRGAQVAFDLSRNMFGDLQLTEREHDDLTVAVGMIQRGEEVTPAVALATVHTLARLAGVEVVEPSAPESQAEFVEMTDEVRAALAQYRSEEPQIVATSRRYADVPDGTEAVLVTNSDALTDPMTEDFNQLD